MIEPKTKCEQISECRKWPLLLICCALRHLCISLLANPSNTVSNVLLSGSHACNRCRTTGNLLQHFQSHSRLCTLMRSCSRAMRTQAYTTQRHQAQCTKGLLVRTLAYKQQLCLVETSNHSMQQNGNCVYDRRCASQMDPAYSH